jgi:hypothetical protein
LKIWAIFSNENSGCAGFLSFLLEPNRLTMNAADPLVIGGVLFGYEVRDLYSSISFMA